MKIDKSELKKPRVQRDPDDPEQVLLRCRCGDVVVVRNTGLFKHTQDKDGHQTSQSLSETGWRHENGAYQAQPYKDRKGDFDE